jgi:hypothetical protein
MRCRSGQARWKTRKKRQVRGIELGRNARRRNVDETVRSLIIEPVHPVSQRLPIHPADLCRIGREAPWSTAAIANNRRACATSFACFANRRTSPAV